MADKERALLFWADIAVTDRRKDGRQPAREGKCEG